MKRHIMALGMSVLAMAAMINFAKAEGEGTNFMEDRVAIFLMEQAARANLPVCEAVLIPTSNGQYRVEYRVVRPGQPQVPRPANTMSVVVMGAPGCPR